jgi:outer membrane protein assembly factor BamD (BamD/ComL family)
MLYVSAGIVMSSAPKHHSQKENYMATRGRPREELYDEAFQKLQEGVPKERVYREWLQRYNGGHHDPQLRDNFLKAMNRRAARMEQT